MPCRAACGTRPERGSEEHELRHWGLFRDTGHVRSVLTEMRCHGQQKRARARDGDALALDREAALDQGLQAPRPKDAGDSPAGKGQEALARSGRQNELAVL